MGATPEESPLFEVDSNNLLRQFLRLPMILFGDAPII